MKDCYEYADFDDTIDLLKQINFDFVTCFPYSEHLRAKSSSLDNKVPSKVVTERIKKISRVTRYGEYSKAARFCLRRSL
jgi:tRNA A37 methylthiotransferase MiaB